MRNLFLIILFVRIFNVSGQNVSSWYGNPDYMYESSDGFYILKSSSYYTFPDGRYLFYDSLDVTTQRLSGTIEAHRQVGIWRYFDKAGRISLEEIYPSDTLNNLLIQLYYDSTGALTKLSSHSISSDLDILIGNQGIVMYDEGSNMHRNCNRGNYFISIDSNSVVRNEYWIKNGKQDGVVIERSANGSVYRRKQYTDGQKNGEWIYAMYDGTIYCREIYKNDKLVLLDFPAGKQYFIGKKELEIVDYYPNGQLRLKGKTDKNRKTGNWEFYSEDGKIIGTTMHDEKGNFIGSQGRQGIPDL